GDFGPTNLVLTSEGNISVLDWEFGCSARPMFDFGNLLRPPLEDDGAFGSGLAEGYQMAGGQLPEDWPRLALLADTLAWVQFASRPHVHELVLADSLNRIKRATDMFRVRSAGF